MTRLNARVEQLKRETKGDSMIVVLCILMVLMVMSVSLLMTVSPLLGTSRKNAIGERCRAMAISFNTLLEDELTNESLNTPGSMQEMLQAQLMAGSWSYYDPHNASIHSMEASKREFEALGNGSVDVGTILDGYDIHTQMYWIWDEEEASQSPVVYDGIQLVVIVNATKNEEMFKLQTTYNLKVEDNNWIWEKEGTL